MYIWGETGSEQPLDCFQGHWDNIRPHFAGEAVNFLALTLNQSFFARKAPYSTTHTTWTFLGVRSTPEVSPLFQKHQVIVADGPSALEPQQIHDDSEFFELFSTHSEAQPGVFAWSPRLPRDRLIPRKHARLQ